MVLPIGEGRGGGEDATGDQICEDTIKCLLIQCTWLCSLLLVLIYIVMTNYKSDTPLYDTNITQLSRAGYSDIMNQYITSISVCSDSSIVNVHVYYYSV